MSKELTAVRRAIAASRVFRKQIAEDAGLSYATLHAWTAGIREPTTESMEKLAAGLERRADRLRRLAADLRRVAGA